MKGLQLSKVFYEELGAPLLAAHFPSYMPRLAVGLAGRGSQCLGYDDTTSHDHGWGPQFLVFMTEEDFAEVGSEVTQRLATLPQDYQGFANKHRPTMAVSIPAWFQTCLDNQPIPSTPTEWLPLNENRLLEATNGAIWYDSHGDVTRVRRYLSYYPDDVWRSRLAQKLWQVTDSGVYNFVRAVRRDHTVTASLALSRFVQEALEFCFLLNRRYAPYFKWLYRGFEELPHLSHDLQPEILGLISSASLLDKQDAMYRICALLRTEVHRQFPETRDIARKDDFFDFWNISIALKDSIQDDEIRVATVLRPA